MSQRCDDRLTPPHGDQILHVPKNRDQGRSRVAHLRKVIARDATGEEQTLQTPAEVELQALIEILNAKFPGWDEPAPPPEFPPTLKACKRLETRVRALMTAEGANKKSRAAHRETLDQLAAHMREHFPE
ncbi:MAG: hypothetical protein JWM80_4804 [Cyanobacteria bacterium RYN_339]|nr:hypothetical protein [Cyanobacteria bacterium RYN_339]